jgi:hypothetical protein
MLGMPTYILQLISSCSQSDTKSICSHENVDENGSNDERKQMQPPKLPHVRLHLTLLWRRRPAIVRRRDIFQGLGLVLPVLAVSIVKGRHIER